MLTKNCDLHLHSNFSDSDADLKTIFQGSSQKKLSCIALTDHDTIAGLAEAAELSRTSGIELINAIELSAQHQDREVHILGYFIDTSSSKLNQELGELKEFRNQRFRKMIVNLNSLGVKIDQEELMQSLAKTIPTRLHLALHLVKKRKVKSLADAFRKFLSPGQGVYTVGFKHSVEQAIQLIKHAKCIAFLAHPQAIFNQSWIEDFIALGLDGLEVSYPGMPKGKSLIYQNMTKKYQLLKSGGSDYHGSFKSYTDLGSVHVPYAWVEAMKERLAKV